MEDFRNIKGLKDISTHVIHTGHVSSGYEQYDGEPEMFLGQPWYSPVIPSEKRILSPTGSSSNIIAANDVGKVLYTLIGFASLSLSEIFDYVNKITMNNGWSTEDDTLQVTFLKW